MSLQGVITGFQNVLNRDDCSATQAQTFIVLGMQRIQRDCRLPSMERQLIIDCEGLTNMIPIPADMIQPIDIIVNPPGGAPPARPKALKKLPYRKLIDISPQRWPEAYARMQGQYWIAGTVPSGATIQLFYYGNFSPFASLSADNELTASTPDLAVYAGLSYAGPDFEHPNAQVWEQRYQEIRAAVQQMGDDLDAEGGPQSVQRVYGQDEWGEW
jgi:hypothetical protein